MIDLRDFEEARREARLEASTCDWQPLPPAPAPPAPGQFPLAASIAEQCSLPVGFPVNADEFRELLGLAAGWPSTRRSSKKDVREEI